MLSDLFRALQFAAERHSAQRRKGPGAEPYINHLLEVGFLLSDIAQVQDQEVLIAGVLHDAVEDTETSQSEIAELFGSRVSQLVAAVTDDKSLPKAERKQLVLDHLASADEAVKLIKLADLCSNISSVPTDWPTERIREYLAWAGQAAALCAGVSAPLDDLFDTRMERSVGVLKAMSGTPEL
jgi:(p)ppGpp synthase/HD superfamily hydrolase